MYRELHQSVWHLEDIYDLLAAMHDTDAESASDTGVLEHVEEEPVLEV